MSMFSPVRPITAPFAAGALSGCAISHLLRAQSWRSSGLGAPGRRKSVLVPAGSATITRKPFAGSAWQGE